MRKIAMMINALVNRKKVDEDGELDWIDDKLEELRSRAKGADPPHVRKQNAERRLAEAQCKRARAERHLAEAQASADDAAAEYEDAFCEYEKERANQARCSPAPSSPLSSPEYKDFVDEVSNLRAAAQLDQQGSVVLPAHMAQAVFFLASPRPSRLVRRGQETPRPGVATTPTSNLWTATARTTCSRRRRLARRSGS